jgi:hypothetical protein
MTDRSGRTIGRMGGLGKERHTFMLKTLAAAIAVGILAAVSLTVAPATGTTTSTDCWDQYNLLGTRRYGTIVPTGITRARCTTGHHCFWGYDTAGKKNRLFVPYNVSPRKCLQSQTTTSTTSSTSTSTTSTTSTTLATNGSGITTTTDATPVSTAPSTSLATSVPPTTTVTPPSTDGTFVADFTGNTGLEQFETGVFHRADERKIESWTADHDASCGDPSTQRVVHAAAPHESFFLCRDHLMTSVGDVAGYSIGWFTPRQTFQRGVHTQVSWDVNVTDLGGRQWWEVSISPVTSPYLATVDWVAAVANIDAYDDQTIAVGKGPLGNDGSIFTQGTGRDPLDWRHVCDNTQFAVDAEGCGSKAIRRTFTVTDNLDGTITVDFLGERYTYPGSFPKQFKVYFKDHNYTPDKDGVPVGHTWHWDNIVVR